MFSFPEMYSKNPVINCVCKGHRDKMIKVPDPVVKDLISEKTVKQIT